MISIHLCIPIHYDGGCIQAGMCACTKGTGAAIRGVPPLWALVTGIPCSRQRQSFSRKLLLQQAKTVHPTLPYTSTAGYLNVGPIGKIMFFCDLSVREKAWRAASHAFERMHSTLSHRSNTFEGTRRYSQAAHSLAYLHMLHQAASHSQYAVLILSTSSDPIGRASCINQNISG